MEPVFIAMWETRDHLYQGFGHTRLTAQAAALQGYRKMCKQVSGQSPSQHDIDTFGSEVSTTELQIGKCLIDTGRQGWL